MSKGTETKRKGLFLNFAVKNILRNHFSSLRVAQNIFTRHRHLWPQNLIAKNSTCRHYIQPNNLSDSP
ncbi:hypothetical protein J7438_10170 [Thalassotalea sp. G20_0]|nr:hypothetical protein [Thalassotalea sp. G20_0]